MVLISIIEYNHLMQLQETGSTVDSSAKLLSFWQDW